MESNQISMTIPSVHATQLIWSQKSLKQFQSSQEINYDQNFISANSKFKDSFLLSHIKPNYGSLGEFMTNIDINKDFLMQKKKKNQGQEEYQQRKIRNLLKNKNLDQILKSQNSNILQRGVACKIMIENIFQQAFGTDINQFYLSNNKVQNAKKKPINISNLSQALDKAIKKEQSVKNSIFNQGLLFNNKNIRKKKSFLTKDQIQLNEKQDKFKIIQQTKNSYRNLVKFSIVSDNKQIQLLQCKKNQPQSPVKKVRIFKTFEQEHFQLNQTTLKIVCKQKIEPKTFLNIIGKINYETLQKIQIVKTQIMEDLIFLLCDLVVKFSKKLKILFLEQLNFKNSQKLSCKIKQIFQTNILSQVKLNKLGLQTKDFCVICLGIGFSKQLQMIQMKANNIDQSGKKSYDVIMKFFKDMSFNIEGNPLAKEVNKFKPVGSKVFIK